MAIVLRCLSQSCVVSFSMRLLVPYILLAGAIDENGVAISVRLPFPYCVLSWVDEACWVRMGRGAYCCKAAFSEWSGSVVGAAVGLTRLLLYFPSFFAVRCIGRCSALHLPSQHAASGFAPQCAGPLCRYVAGRVLPSLGGGLPVGSPGATCSPGADNAFRS